MFLLTSHLKIILGINCLWTLEFFNAWIWTEEVCIYSAHPCLL